MSYLHLPLRRLFAGLALLLTPLACGGDMATAQLDLLEAADLSASLAPLGRDKPHVMRAAAEETSAAELGKLGSQRSTTGAVRDYAESMQLEHGDLRQQLLDMAKRRGSLLPVSMSTSGERQHASLRSRPVSLFDRDFLILQIQLQAQAASRLGHIGSRAIDPEVKAWAQHAAGIWRRDESYARQLHEGLFVTTSMDDHSEMP